MGRARPAAAHGYALVEHEQAAAEEAIAPGEGLHVPLDAAWRRGRAQVRARLWCRISRALRMRGAACIAGAWRAALRATYFLQTRG